MIKKEPYTKDTQPMARDPLHTREQPILHTGGTADPQHKEGTRWTEPLA